MMKNALILAAFAGLIGFGHLSVWACMCPGVNPELYPPDVKKSREYYKKEFNGAAFTGKVLASEEATDVLREGKKVQKLTVEVERYWFGVVRRSVTIYAPKDDSACWVPFLKNESYFFIPTLQDGRLHIEICAYATFNRKHDGNYVAFMVKMFGKGNKFDAER